MNARRLCLTIALASLISAAPGQNPSGSAATSAVPVTNLPFTAEEMTTTSLLQPDGTAVTVLRRVDVARNSVGSTRRELRILPNSDPASQPTGTAFADIHDVPNSRFYHVMPDSNSTSTSNQLNNRTDNKS